MAAGVNIPKPAHGPNMGALLSLAGAGAGGALGGLPGAGAGMGLGGTLGGMAQREQPAVNAVEPEQSAMSRRLQSLNDTPLSQIRQSIDSLKYVQDDAMKAELAKPLIQAEMQARRMGPNVG